MFRTILFASDGSENALRAAKTAAELASKFAARLIMLHVFEIPVTPGLVHGSGWVPMPLEPPSQEIQEAVVAHTRSALPEGVAVEDLREIGYPAASILRVAEEQQAELVVLGCRGMGAVGRFLMGSVSDNVLHHAHCAVLIVK